MTSMRSIGQLDLTLVCYDLNIQKQEQVAQLPGGHIIYRIVQVDAVKLTQHSDTTLIQDDLLARKWLDDEILESTLEILNGGHFYYSPTYDLTHSLQHNYLLQSTSSHVQPDDRYYFNQHLNVNNTDKIKLICGFVGSFEMGNNETVLLISRMNHRRVGTRYLRRGLDMQGNAVNSVEMEQIVYFQHQDTHCFSSFVQLRGSVPSIWSQEMDFSYRPKLVIAPLNEHVWKAAKAHFDDVVAMYPGPTCKDLNQPTSLQSQVTCINLLDDKGFEGDLTNMYERLVNQYAQPDRLEYISFPINKWCKKMNFRNMDILLSRMKDRLVNGCSFLACGQLPGPQGASLHVYQMQQGLARVSCLDSLDRTNLTCSLFAKFMLPLQLYHIRQVDVTSPLSSSPFYPFSLPVNSVSSPCDLSFLDSIQQQHVSLLTHMWADSGDAISILYAGTPALKADVTRTGKRDWIKGNWEDGNNALTRYYLNHFSDGRKQDAFDVVCGKVSKSDLFSLIEKQASSGQSVSLLLEKAKRKATTQSPLMDKKSGIGYWLPPIIVDKLDPIVQTAVEFKSMATESMTHTTKDQSSSSSSSNKWLPDYSSFLSGWINNDHLNSDGQPSSYVGLFMNTLRYYAPAGVHSLVDKVAAVVVFCYMLVFIKLFQIQGNSCIEKPRFHRCEDQDVYEEMIQMQELQQLERETRRHRLKMQMSIENMSLLNAEQLVEALD